MTTNQRDGARYVRFEFEGRRHSGVMEGTLIQPLRGAPFSSPEPDGAAVPLDRVRLLPPVEPSKVIGVGLNYKSHLAGRTPPSEPSLFLKLPSCIIGPGEAIALPAGAGPVHCEAELVLVIGKTAKNVREEDAHEFILGATCGNDVSARAWQQADLQWFRAKATDTFGPMGPAVVSGLDLDDLGLEGRLNGQVVQSQRTSDLIFSTSELLSYVSRYVTLLPGDLIFTGTPGRTEAIKPGDVFEVEIEGIGVLSNPVIEADSDTVAR